MAQTAIFAQDTEHSVTFTVDKAVEYALANSHTLKSADIDLEIKQRAAQYSWNALVPTIKTSGTLSRQNDIDSTIESANASVQMANAIAYLTTGRPGTTKKTKETESMHWAGVGNVGISWNFSLAYIEQIQAAKADYETGRISLEQSRKETETNVKKLFYGLLLQQENIKLQKESLEIARRRSVQSRTNWDNGVIPELSYLQAYIAYENKRPEVADAERTFKQQLDTFAFILGLPVGTDIALKGSIEPNYVEFDADHLIAEYGNATLDLQSLNATKANLEHNLKALNLSSYTPALALNWSWQPMITDAFNKSWTDTDNWNDGGSFSATIAWELTNLFPFSKNRQQAQDLKDNIRKIDVSLNTLKENQRLEVKKSIDALKTARDQIDAMDRNIKLAQRSYDMAETSYQAGTTELLELRDTETQLNQAKLGLLNQKYNYISALLDLEQALNMRIGETR